MKLVFLLFLLFIALLLVIVAPFTFANGEGVGQTVEEVIKGTSITLIFWGSLLLGLLILIALLHKNKGEREKKVLFGLIVVSVVVVTAYVMGSTIYLNFISVTGGPVHWHADYEIWVCEKEIDIEDPKLPLNRLGTYVLHDHGDNRMHIEGVVLDKRDVSLGAFFHAIGGELSKDELIVPTNQGLVEASEGDLCDGSPGKLYVFVKGKLVEDPSSYVIQPYETIPPGDTIKVVFSSSSLEEIDPNRKGYDREKRI